jgi:site-specific recombinase XerD
VFASRLNAFVAYKKSLGLIFDTAARNLTGFDKYCIAHNVTEPVLTRQLAEAWTAPRDNESHRTMIGRCQLIRTFAQYLTLDGEKAWIYPPQKNVAKSNFVPYIYSQAELNAIWAEADKMEFNGISPYIYIEVPTMLRLLYGCGMRVSEACSLKKTQCNLKTGIITILDDKNGKDRLNPMSDSLLAMMREYSKKITAVCPDTEFVFPNRAGNHITRDDVHWHFRRFLARAGISHGGRGKGPRVHDLRHTFAFHSLWQMESQGLDLYCALPLLSAYLGHYDITSTEKYLRLTGEVHGSIVEKLESDYGSIAPYATGEVME